ncbi:MAG TPA: lytic murein transglycosylase [Acidimicrobiales bacterium]|nr:lytic murein transglycosylase [Acidimicrobiales bacterium]
MAVAAALAALVAVVPAASVGAQAGPGRTSGPAAAAAAPTDPAEPVDPTGPADPADPADPTGAGSTGGAPAVEEAPPVGPLPELAEELADVEVTSEAYDTAVARRSRLTDERAAALRLIREKTVEIEQLTARDAALTQAIEDARSNARYWEGQAERIAASMREIAISSYISGSAGSLDPVLTFDAEAQQDMATQDVTVGSLSERRLAELQQARRNARNNRNTEQISTALRGGVRDGLAAARATRDEATADEARLGVALVEAQAGLAEASRLATVVGADFPLVVLDAYWKGAELMSLLSPGCGVPWWGLAGIGKVESRHGTYGGSEVRADGSLTKPIIGIPLTGFGGTAAIGDSDGGVVDGDPTVDRAAGPMQFIPQTWASWGRDGDGNDRIEIQNIYDAAAGAAAYLCASGALADDAGLSRGYFSYNHSLEYVASVLAQAKGYAASVVVPAGG